MKVVAIYDNNGETIDRYTIITDEEKDAGRLECLNMNDKPNSPGGYNQWGVILRTPDRFNFENNKWRTRTDLGKLIPFENLSTELQVSIAKSLLYEEEK